MSEEIKKKKKKLAEEDEEELEEEELKEKAGEDDEEDLEEDELEEKETDDEEVVEDIHGNKTTVSVITSKGSEDEEEGEGGEEPGSELEFHPDTTDADLESDVISEENFSQPLTSDEEKKLLESYDKFLKQDQNPKE